MTRIDDLLADLREMQDGMATLGERQMGLLLQPEAALFHLATQALGDLVSCLNDRINPED
jgi:hypothetical protein